MVFTNLGHNSMSKTQEDLVSEQKEVKLELNEEVFSSDSQLLPGLKMIHLMSESQLIDFFNQVLRVRSGRKHQLIGVELILGNYEFTEEVARIPNSSSLHNMSFIEIARVFVMALSMNSRSIGFKAELLLNNDGTGTSRIFTRVGKKQVKGPAYDEDNRIIQGQEGDEEFNPVLVLKYS